MTGCRRDLAAEAAGARPLVVGAVLAALEGLVLLVYAVLELATSTPAGSALAVTTAVFFAVLGGGAGRLRLRPVAGPLLGAQPGGGRRS